MEWDEYREQVASSRELIVHPFFLRNLSGLGGIGLDIGCGDGDITAAVAQEASGLVVGIDLDDVQITRAKERRISNVHFREGDVSKSAILSTGLKYDYAFSNCCFPHLSDSDVYKTLLDLHASLKEEGLFVCLVPSLSWAKEMYASILHIGSGITAIPRYGERQWFRLPE